MRRSCSLNELQVVPFIVKLKGLISKIQKGLDLTIAKSQNISSEIRPKMVRLAFRVFCFFGQFQLEAKMLIIQVLNAGIQRLISSNITRACIKTRDLACCNQDQSLRGLVNTLSQVSTIDSSIGSFCQTPPYTLRTTFPQFSLFRIHELGS